MMNVARELTFEVNDDEADQIRQAARYTREQAVEVLDLHASRDRIVVSARARLNAAVLLAHGRVATKRRQPHVYAVR